jgi:hypothetical protein
MRKGIEAGGGGGRAKQGTVAGGDLLILLASPKIYHKATIPKMCQPSRHLLETYKDEGEGCMRAKAARHEHSPSQRDPTRQAQAAFTGGRLGLAPRERERENGVGVVAGHLGRSYQCRRHPTKKTRLKACRLALLAKARVLGGGAWAVVRKSCLDLTDLLICLPPTATETALRVSVGEESRWSRGQDCTRARALSVLQQGLIQLL